jgi:hypothetical protein
MIKKRNLHMIQKLLILSGYIILVCGSAAIADDRSNSGDLKYIRGPKNAEDILPLGDTPWLITSGLNGQFSNTDDTGHIYLVNRIKKTFEEFFPGQKLNFNHDKEIFNACPGPINRDNFSAHGLALQQRSPEQFRLYITSHGEREAIEAFDINTKGTRPSISWVGCVLLPDKMLANSVAILSDGGFVTTKFFDPTLPNPFNAFSQGRITGGVYEWHPGGNVNAIQGTELSGANGIEVSSDNKWVYVAASGTREIIRFNRTENPVTAEKVQISIVPDNIRWGDDGMLYTAGSNYVPPEECENPPCETGWSVFSIDHETLKAKRVTGVDQTATMQNASSAIAVGNEIWVGTFSGDRIGYLPKP